MKKKKEVSQLEVDIIKRLDQWREDHDISQVDFAKGLGIEANTYRNMVSLESNTPISKNIIFAAISAFPIDAEWLFKGKGNIVSTLNEPEVAYQANNMKDIKEILIMLNSMKEAWNKTFFNKI